MTEPADRAPSPPYVSFATLTTFFDQLRETRVVPDVIDRSFLKNFSGAAQNEIVAALKFFAFIDAKGRAAPSLESYALSSNEERKVKLNALIAAKYDFVLNAPGINIAKATTNQVADAFRGKDLSGSTLSRSMSFFIAAAKFSGIGLADYLKPTPIAREGGPKRKKAATQDLPDGTDQRDGHPDNSKTKPHNFEIPIPGKSSVKISVPADFDSEDWELLTTMFQAYVKRWKSFALPANGQTLV